VPSTLVVGRLVKEFKHLYYLFIMKSRIVAIAVIFGAMLLIWSGCGNSLEKKVIGVWKIENIKLSGDTSQFNREQFLSTIDSQKKFRFELKQDSSVAIYTGSAEIDGVWYCSKKGKLVFVILEGNTSPTLLGEYQEGKLINSDTTISGAIINTIFVKPEIVEKDVEKEDGSDTLQGL